MSALYSKVKEWEQEGSVVKVECPPPYINPLTVNVEHNEKGEVTKKRPCIDVSRCLNKHFPKVKTKLDTLNRCDHLISTDCFMTSLDLSNAYFHVRLHKDSRKFMGFQVENEQGEVEFFLALVMMYGLSIATEILTRFIRPLKSYCHKLGIIFSMYLDDGRVVAQFSDECKFKTQIVLLILQLSGFNINWKKSHLDPSQSLHYQGFLLNSSKMLYFATLDKETSCRMKIKNLLDLHQLNGEVPCILAASVLGSVQSLKTSHGSIVNIIPRSSQNELGRQVIKNKMKWDSNVVFIHGIKEFIFLEKFLPIFNGKPITNDKNPGHVMDQVKVKNIMHNIKQSDSSIKNLLVSDASDKKVAILYHGDIFLILEHDFTVTESEYSSAHRELLALIIFLIYCKESHTVFSSPLLIWQTDSSSVYYFMRKGSRNIEIQNTLLKIKYLELELKITTVIVWTPRTHSRIKLLDEMSKTNFEGLSSDDWGVPRYILRNIFSYFQYTPTIDCFASENNTVCSKYFSRYFEELSSGVDFYAQILEKSEIYYCCPPSNEVGFVFNRIVSNPGPIYILVFPVWYASNWWPLIFLGKSYHPAIKALYMFNCKMEVFNSCPAESMFNKDNYMKMAAVLIK